MKKYYLTAIKHINDGTEARECLSSTELDTLKATMYRKQANAIDDPNCDYAFAVINNYLGQAIVQPIGFARPTEVEEEPEA